MKTVIYSQISGFYGAVGAESVQMFFDRLLNCPLTVSCDIGHCEHEYDGSDTKY